MEDKTLRQTPLYIYHKNLGAKMAPFGGWIMPIQYEGIIAEHNFCRQSAALFDICHMGEFYIHADPEKIRSELVMTFDLSAMPLGSCKYGFMLNDKGGIVDDLIAYRIDSGKWMVVVNAATKDNDFRHIDKNLPNDIIVEDISEKTGKIDIQGPFSRDVLIAMAGQKISDLSYFRFSDFNIYNKRYLISRTGYTGELGFEIYADIADIVELWNILLEDKRVKPAGLGSRDTLRLEMCYPLYGQDIDEDTTPLEAGLDCFVDFKKKFMGKDILMKQRQDGLNKRFVSFISDTRRSPRHGDNIYSEGKNIGLVTSGSFSPSLGFGIGTGYVESGYDWVGAHISLKNDRSELAAQITDKPFYRKGTVRS
jgi:aminomethyltransferase